VSAGKPDGPGESVRPKLVAGVDLRFIFGRKSCDFGSAELVREDPRRWGQTSEEAKRLLLSAFVLERDADP
jgi:hypothetical protein